MQSDIIVTNGNLAIAGVPSVNGGASEVLEMVDSLSSQQSPTLLVTPNVDHILELSSNSHFRAAYGLADSAIVDGMPVAKLARLLGAREVQRNTGADLLNWACAAASERGWRVAILGGRVETCRKAAAELRAATGADVHAIEVPHIESVDSDAWDSVITRLSDVEANVVFVCLGSPKQELWYAQWRHKLPPAVYIGAGAAVDFAAGASSRAPSVVQKMSLEWLWRLGQDPKRLWKRYLVRGPQFLKTVVYALAKNEHTRQRVECTSTTILQIGPSPVGSGGMAAVGREMLSLDFRPFVQESQPTWGDRTGLWSLVSGAQVGFRMISRRRQWAVAHVHLSEFGSFVREGSLVVLARRLGRPSVVTLHGAEFEIHARRHPHLTRWVLRNASIAVCLGRSTEAAVRGLVPALPTKVVMNPLASRYIASDTAPLRTKPTQTTFVFAGERGLRKGTDRLLKAWPVVRRQIPDARLIVAGPDPKDKSEMVRQDELEGVEYYSNLSREQIAAFITESTAAVLPSRAEVLPMFILESLALGTPAIYTMVGEWRELESCDGVSVLPEIEETALVEELSAQMIKIALHEDWSSVSEVARQWAAGHVSPAVVSAELSSVYARLTKPDTYEPKASRRQ